MDVLQLIGSNIHFSGLVDCKHFVNHFIQLGTHRRTVKHRAALKYGRELAKRRAIEVVETRELQTMGEDFELDVEAMDRGAHCSNSKDDVCGAENPISSALTKMRIVSEQLYLRHSGFPSLASFTGEVR